MKLLNYHFKEHDYIVDNKKDINKKIVLISDIHYGNEFKKDKINIILSKIKSIEPDYVCITGDLIDNINVLSDNKLKKEVLDFLNKLTTISKVIMCIGNHDQFILKKRAFRCIYEFASNDEWFKELREIPNLILLDNEIWIDNDIRFIGFTPSFKYYKEEKDESILLNELKNKMPAIKNDCYNILLIHSPINVLNSNTIKDTYIKNVDIILTGHTHNGMVPPILDDVIKGNTGIYSPNGSWFWKAKKTRGKYELDNKILIINGAITKIHGCSPKWMVLFNELFPMSIDIISLDGGKK